MPFGLDLKSLIVGVIIAMYVVPFVLGLINRPKNTTTAA